MRRCALFLVAFVLASVAVRGQEERGSDLLDRIDSLTRELEARLAARDEAASAHRVELRTYEVSDLIQPIADALLERANLKPSKFQPPEAPEPGEPCAPFEIDMLIELIRIWVEPESWDTIEGSDIQPRNGRLLVTTVPRIHEQIARFLRGLRGASSGQVAVDVVAVAVTPETLAALGAPPRELPPEVASRLLREHSLGAVRLLGHDGQQVVQRAGGTRTYLADYDVQIAQEASIGKPVRAAVHEGCGAQVRAILDREAHGVLLHVRIDRTRFKEPLRQAETVHGPVDLPAMGLTRLNTSLWAPLDRTVVLGGGARAGDGCVFLATARRLGP